MSCVCVDNASLFPLNRTHSCQGKRVGIQSHQPLALILMGSTKCSRPKGPRGTRTDGSQPQSVAHPGFFPDCGHPNCWDNKIWLKPHRIHAFLPPGPSLMSGQSDFACSSACNYIYQTSGPSPSLGETGWVIILGCANP